MAAGRSSGPREKGAHLDNRCVAGPFKNRRRAEVDPLAGSAGRAVHPPRHRLGLRLERLQDTAGEIAPRLRNRQRDAVHRRHRDAGPFGRGVRHAGRPLRTALGHGRCHGVLLQWADDRRMRSFASPVLARRGRVRGRRRGRPRHRLHLAGVYADQVVSRSPGHGDRPRDHGLRRRGADRVPVDEQPARRVRAQQHLRSRQDLPGDGLHLRGFHVDGLPADPGAGAGMDAGRPGNSSRRRPDR